MNKKLTAWQTYQAINQKFGSRFRDELYQWFAADAKTLSYSYAGTFRLLSKPEGEAIQIMRQVLSSLNGEKVDWRKWTNGQKTPNTD